MKKFLLRKPYILAILLVLVIGGATAFALTRPEDTPSYVDTPKPVSSDESSSSGQSDSDSSPSTPDESQTPQNLPVIGKPTLVKSSGNNGPVPNKASIQFICSGVLDANCFVTLTNGNENLKFDAKPIKDDGRGNASVSWIWEAKPGTWTIKATLSASGYQQNSSDPQTITVNE